jgi:coenzyme PQQ synthesis protein D (PqqD)
MDPQRTDLNQTIALSPAVISQKASNETVLLDLDSENYFGLDEVGTRICQLIKETNELQAIFDTLLEEYDITEERLQLDLTTLLTEIEALGLVVLKQRKSESP